MAKSIQIEHLFKVFGDNPKQALKLVRAGRSKQDVLEQTGQTIGVFDASFTIGEGELFVVMGLSGSGKSTLVRMLNRLIEPTTGRIVVGGDDIGRFDDARLRTFRRREVSMVFQSFALLPHLNVLDNTAFGLEMAGVDKAERLGLAREALAQVGLSAWAQAYPDELSGGMQQRVGLARALAADPAILLMDEAFSALDPIIRADMQDELLRLQSEKRRTIVFISHDLDEAMRIGDRIAIMKDGHVVQVGTPGEILGSPADDYVRAFIRGVDAAAVFKASDIARKTQVEVAESPARGCRPALQRLERQDRDWAYVVSPQHEFLGVVSSESLSRALRGHPGPRGLRHAFLPVAPVAGDTPISALYTHLVGSPCPLPVVSATGRFLGAISHTTLLQFLDPTTDPRGNPLPGDAVAAPAADDRAAELAPAAAPAVAPALTPPH